MKRNLFISSVLFLSVLMTLSSCADNQEIAVNQETEFGTKEEANDLLTRAVNLVKLNEVVGFTMITIPNTGFQTKDLYPFCFDQNGILLAHPYSLGGSIKELVSEDGVKVGAEMLKNAKKNKISEISYEFPIFEKGVLTDQTGTKTTLYTKVNNYVCGSGFYSD